MEIGEVTPIVLFLLGEPIPQAMDYGVRDWMLALHTNKEMRRSDEDIALDPEAAKSALAIARLREELHDKGGEDPTG